MKQRLLSIFVLALAVVAAKAQDDFNPTLPGEPNAYYKISVSVSPEEAGFASGSGLFMNGESVRISTSSYIDYTFRYWTLNGERYSEDMSFNYIVGTEDAAFVAVYDYTPVDIDDISSVVYLQAMPSDACSFNCTSGGRYNEDCWLYLYFWENQGFVFKGWYKGNELLSSSREFNYFVGHDDVTLTAKFDYVPVIPGEPSSNQSDVATVADGDVNSDGNIDVQDVVSCINIILESGENNRADVNNDGLKDVQDIVTLINKILAN